MKKPFMMFNADNSRLKMSKPGVIEGFEAPKDYPKCCPRHKMYLEYIMEWWKKFPDCCDEHRKLAKNPIFEKKVYDYVPERIMTVIAYFEYHISQKIEQNDWFEDIMNYHEYLVMSFGMPAVGLGKLSRLIEHFVEYANPEDYDFTQEKKDKLLKELQKEPSQTEQHKKDTDPNILYEVYQKWLKTVPDIHYFSYLKARTTGKAPMNLFIYEPKHNPYTGMTGFKMRTKHELVANLFNLTKEALSKIDTTQLVKDGLISEAQQTNINLLNENHRIKQLSLFEEYTESESKYLEIVKSWLANEEEYFEKILPQVQSLPAPIPTKEKKYNWIRYVKYQTDIEPLKDLLDGLKKIGCILETATFPNFKKIFSGEELKDPYHWAGNIGDLATLIKELDKQLKIEKLSFKWKTTAATFTDTDDIPIDKDKLRNSKATTNAEQIKQLVSYL